MGRILWLPKRGRLFAATDLQGNLEDFARIRELFVKSLLRREDSYLLFTGDLIHGPEIPPEHWPSYLGDFYHDQSGEVVLQFANLAEQFPGRVHCLLGNHEHAHIGGPSTAKFHDDDVLALEYAIGPQNTERLKQLFRAFPLLAISPCGIVFTHGAPAAAPVSPEEVEQTSYEGYETATYEDLARDRVLGPLLWSRGCEPSRATAFLQAIAGESGHIAAFGHDVVPSGYECNGAEQICFSTSFGLFNKDKVYLDLDLASHYRSVHDLRDDIEIRKLYP
jgi:Calcineurin-like phosphoesterase